MDFAVFTMPEHMPWSNWSLGYDLDLEKIKIAERLGFSEFWIGEHHAGGYENVPVPEYYIARASAVTSRIRLGTGTVNLPYHDPFMIAERLAFLDQLTRGRLIYGVGGGGLPFDQELFGTGPTASERFDEALAVVEQLWSASVPTSFEGKFYSFEQREIQVRPYQATPPIAVAGLRNLNKYELCGEKGYIPLSMYYVRPASIAGLNALSLSDQIAAATAATARTGRDPDEPRRKWHILREVYVASSRNQAIEELRAGHKHSYDYILALGIGDLIQDRLDMPVSEMTFEWMIDSFPMIIGSPEECIHQIHELELQTGGFGTLVLNDRNWVPLDLWSRSMELFMRYVAPAFIRREDQARRRRLVDKALSRSSTWPATWWEERPRPWEGLV